MSQKSTQTELHKHAFRELMKDVGTSVPGHVVAFDSTTQLAQLQIGIKQTTVDGEQFSPAVIIECPVQFVGGDAFMVEHQIDPGDECLIIFSQRCIDGWRNTGGVANNPIKRFHDINDAYFIPGLRSQPNTIKGFSNNGVKIRNKSGDQFIWLKNDSTADITVPTLYINGNIIHKGNNAQTGDHNVTGNVTATIAMTSPTFTALTSLTVAGIEMKGHAHAYSWTDTGGSSVTDGPQ